MSHSIAVFPKGSFIRDLCLIRDDYTVFNNCAITKEELGFLINHLVTPHFFVIELDMCGVEGKRRLCDLNVTSSSQALTTQHIRCVLLVNRRNKLNLLSWLLIYLCNK